MAANIFGRYVWLVDTLLRRGKLTFREINELWQKSDLGYGEELPLRTFHNHQKAIKDIFDIYIDCDRKDGYRYYIDEPERVKGNKFRNWLISSYATLNQIQADNKLENRIIYEDIPSGNKWLTAITEAMRHNHVLEITHRGFGKPAPHTFEVEPYCLKVVKRRWYMIARNPYYSKFLTYALDRIIAIEETGKEFVPDKDFDIDSYFEGCCGVITADTPCERIVIRAYEVSADYLRTLPLHESQKEIGGDGTSALFEYRLKPTLDFYQLVLSQADQLEIIEPQTARDAMLGYASRLMDYYGKKDS